MGRKYQRRGTKKGTVTVMIKVGDLQGQNFQEEELEVDTGATFTALPRELLQALRVPVSRITSHGSLTEVRRQ